MSSELFERCEDEFKQVYTDVKYQLTEQLPKCTGETQRQLIRNLERQLDNARKLVEQMERDVHTAPAPFRTQMSARVRSYRQDLDLLLSNIKQTNSSRLDIDRGNLGYADQDDQSSIDRTRLLQGTAILNRASDSIARSHAISAETDQIGTEIIDDLGTQRESLLRTRTRLTETDHNLSQTRRILQTMSRRIMTNKLLLMVIILLELGILGGVIYWRFFSK